MNLFLKNHKIDYLIPKLHALKLSYLLKPLYLSKLKDQF